MATVRELSAPYANFMLPPRRGPGVCTSCFNLTDGYDRCYACTRRENVVAAMVPVSYSVAHEQLHHALASYKRLTGTAGRRLAVQLAAVLWRFLSRHEDCLARAAGAKAFPFVTTVPSGDVERDDCHSLRWIVGEAVGATRARHERLLRRSAIPVPPRAFAPEKYDAHRPLSGEPVLLVDDTWTTGGNAQSAAASLLAAGSGPVAVVVIGRHVNRDWHDNDAKLRRLPGFGWDTCGLCAKAPTPEQQPAPG